MKPGSLRPDAGIIVDVLNSSETKTSGRGVKQVEGTTKKSDGESLSCDNTRLQTVGIVPSCNDGKVGADLFGCTATGKGTLDRTGKEQWIKLDNHNDSPA